MQCICITYLNTATSGIRFTTNIRNLTNSLTTFKFVLLNKLPNFCNKGNKFKKKIYNFVPECIPGTLGCLTSDLQGLVSAHWLSLVHFVHSFTSICGLVISPVKLSGQLAAGWITCIGT